MSNRVSNPHDQLAHSLRDLPHASLCVGFSGGLDSTALLHALVISTDARARGLRAWHVHHGLHAEADQWVEHCHTVCRALDIALSVTRVAVTVDGEGIEAAARNARYSAFAAGLETGEVLVLAHHRDDQAETFLLRALRGSGADGLGAMRAWRDIGRGRVWRPLLGLPRDALLAYATGHGLDWIEDSSNADTALDRNFLRHRILPVLRQRWPHAEAALAGAATLCGQASALLQVEDDEALAALTKARADVVSLPALRRLPDARRARVLRRWIATLGLPALPAKGIAQIEHDLMNAPPDAEASFLWHGAAVRAWRDGLHAGWVAPALPPEWMAVWDGSAPLPLPSGGSLALVGAPQFDDPVTVHPRRGGERIVLPGRAHSHALKNLLQELAVPPWERASLPLLSMSTGEILAVGSVVRSARFDAWLRKRDARLLHNPARPVGDRAGGSALNGDGNDDT